MTECKGDMGAFGFIQLYTPSSTPGFYLMEMILKVTGVESVLEERIHVSSANVASRLESWVGGLHRI